MFNPGESEARMLRRTRNFEGEGNVRMVLMGIIEGSFRASISLLGVENFMKKNLCFSP